MRRINQRYRSDCFPTCIAMIAGISHSEAIKLVHPFRFKGTDYGTHDDRGMAALRRLGFKVRKRKNINFTTLNQVAIVCISFHDLKNIKQYHVVVWDPIDKKILDPSPYDKNTPISFYKDNMEWVILVS